MMEMCALYFSRTLMDTLAGTPLLGDADSAFLKIERALPAGCRKFIDQLPRLLTAKIQRTQEARRTQSARDPRTRARRDDAPAARDDEVCVQGVEADEGLHRGAAALRVR